MISKIVLNRVASYKAPSTLLTDKKVNLIYGLNGTGKSTLSNFMYNTSDPSFANCTIEDISNTSMLVYNQKFIRDYFYEDEKLKGIFTLSKENKVAEQKISSAKQEIERQLKIKEGKAKELLDAKDELSVKGTAAENQTWNIKTTFSGGDRVLEYCLRGLMGKKEALFNHITSLPCPPKQPIDGIDSLKKEVDALKGNDAQKYSTFQSITLDLDGMESRPILQKEIVGNKNSTVADLISKLENSDWVKDGLQYILITDDNSKVQCPFCQEITINLEFVNRIKSFFDKSYENDLAELKGLGREYFRNIGLLPSRETYLVPPAASIHEQEFNVAYLELQKTFSENNKLIDDKIRNPSKKVELLNSTSARNKLNDVIQLINDKIQAHNLKLDNKEESLESVRTRFWAVMRWDYNQTISRYLSEAEACRKKIKEIEGKIADIEIEVTRQNAIILQEQKNTVNIEESIARINFSLIEIGIDGFSIVKHSDILYKIVRPDQQEKTFHSLSEGEKMVISFLYFCELCNGKKSASDSAVKKIVVIDDPISSLSHIYVFNIATMIKKLFIKSEKFEQVFILTHSLYFFYDLTHTDKDKRHLEQKLFRLSKNSSGSQFLEMKYEEIQNDYHAYWYIVKDQSHPPALIANCMRNIIEYFFNFIEKKDLNNVFQKPELADVKYQAFCRYINRESHSLGQNIFDLKEFDYNHFRSAFELVFKITQYDDHYKVMMK